MQLTEAVVLCLEVLVSLLVGHDVRALEAKIQRTEGYDGLAVRIDVRLRYYTRFIVHELQDRSVVLEGLLARIFEHLTHVFCVVISGAVFIALKSLTTAVYDMRHLTARHNVAFRILDHLGRGQRGRLGAGRCVHGVGDTVWVCAGISFSHG